MDAAGQKGGEGDHHSYIPSDPKRAEILENAYCFLFLYFIYIYMKYIVHIYSGEKCLVLLRKNGKDFCRHFNLVILQLVLFELSMR